MSELKELIVEENGPICTISFNRPEKRNLVTPLMLTELSSELKRLTDEDKVRCVILKGSGDKAFSSGYDIHAIGDNDMIKHHEGDHPLGRALRTVADFPYPTIAMLNGHAFGAGFEIAVTCDIRIAVADSLFGMPPAKLGVVYSHSGMKKFVDLIGPGYTKELFLVGRPVSSERAKEIGLVNFMVSREEIEKFTYDMANEISENAPLTLKTLKKITNVLEKKEIRNEDEKIIRNMTVDVQNSEDYKEGQKAFAEKRKPEFKGK